MLPMYSYVHVLYGEHDEDVNCAATTLWIGCGHVKSNVCHPFLVPDETNEDVRSEKKEANEDATLQDLKRFMLKLLFPNYSKYFD